jgi:hypothetical protein
MARVLAYAWASPATALGLAVALLACVRGRIRVRQGVVEAEGPLLAWSLKHWFRFAVALRPSPSVMS